jgi:hypothetical protein
MPDAAGRSDADSAGVTTKRRHANTSRNSPPRKLTRQDLVDDRNGTVGEAQAQPYRAIIDEAHKHSIPGFAHVLELADVKDPGARHRRRPMIRDKGRRRV